MNSLDKQCLKDFEAWLLEYTKNGLQFREIVKSTMYAAWQSAYNRTNLKAANLRNLVCILEDDSEPEPGDLIQAFEGCVGLGFHLLVRNGELYNGHKLQDIAFPDRPWVQTSEGRKLYIDHPCFKIIQRQNKPVIYRSQLTNKETK